MAGQVVFYLASAVKELVDNTLDANSQSINSTYRRESTCACVLLSLWCHWLLSVATLLNRGEVEWDMGRFPLSLTEENRDELRERIDKRRNAAVRIIREFASQETDWLSWAKLDELKNDEPKTRKEEKSKPRHFDFSFFFPSVQLYLFWCGYLVTNFLGAYTTVVVRETIGRISLLARPPVPTHGMIAI